MSKHLVLAAKLAAVFAVAVIAGVAVALGSALLGHEVLVLVYGENLAPIDDTLPMRAGVALSYLAGIVAGLAVSIIGWRRLVRHPRTAADPQ